MFVSFLTETLCQTNSWILCRFTKVAKSWRFETHELIFGNFLQVSEARQNHDDGAIKKAVNEYDEALERFVLCYRKLFTFLKEFSHGIIKAICQNLYSKEQAKTYRTWRLHAPRSLSNDDQRRIVLSCFLFWANFVCNNLIKDDIYLMHVFLKMIFYDPHSESVLPSVRGI